MKKLLLLSALFIFACSSSGDSTSTGQLFLEKYDGVVWGETPNDPSYSFGHIFYNSPSSVTTFEVYNGMIDCYSNIFGNVDAYGTLMDIVSQTEDMLVLEITEDIDGEISTYIATITVTNDGDNLTLERSNEPTGTEYYEKINSSPCN